MSLIDSILHPQRKIVEQRLEKVDQETREVGHTLRNLQTSSEVISLLIRRMREDGSFEDRAKNK